jgi:hypothetical protein
MEPLRRSDGRWGHWCRPTAVLFYRALGGCEADAGAGKEEIVVEKWLRLLIATGGIGFVAWTLGAHALSG